LPLSVVTLEGVNPFSSTRTATSPTARAGFEAAFLEKHEHLATSSVVFEHATSVRAAMQ
jgi:hypothetical protein